MSAIAEGFGRVRSSPKSLSRSCCFFVGRIAQQVQTGVIVDLAPHWSDPEKLSSRRYDGTVSKCQRIDISREELYTSDELFLSGKAAEITPIREVDGRRIGEGDNPITRKLPASFADAVHGRNQHYTQWLTYLE